MNDSILIFERDSIRCDGVHALRSASYSALSSFRSCPGRWLASRVLPTLMDWESPLVTGSIAHGALELAVRTPDVDAPDWDALARKAVPMLRERNLRTGWKPDPIPAGVTLPDGRPAGDADWAALAAGKLHGFRLSDVFGVPLKPACTEQELRETVWGVPMSGSVDYRDMERGVVDWKTGRVPRVNPDGFGHADQLRVYRALLESAGVCEVRQARDVYVEKHVAVPADLSDEAMRATGARIHDTWMMMGDCVEQGSYPLIPSNLCGWCPLANACPMAMVSSRKARLAAERQYPADYPRFRRTGTHEGAVNVVGKEHAMSDMDDLLSQWMNGSTSEPEPAKPTVGSEPAPAGKPVGVDPWASPEGRAALDKWGVKGGGEPVKPPEPKVEQPAVAKPKTETPVAAKPEAKTVDGVRLHALRPYDPSWSDGMVNVAGYGFGRLESLSTTATLLCGSMMRDSVPRVLNALIRLEWQAARDVWGRIVPDVTGLENGTPDVGELLAWLDSPLSRDTGRVFNRVMENSGLYDRRDVPPDVNGLLKDLKAVAQITEQSLTPMRDMLRA